LNVGQGVVENHYRKDYIYLGNNSTFDGTAVIIDSVIYNSASVPVNVPQQLSKQIKLPNGISGTKYVFVRVNVDSSFKEITFGNNTNTTGAQINISLSPSSDLIVSSVNIPNTVYTSIGFPFKYTVSNIGAGTASGKWNDSIFISCNSTFNRTASYYVGVRSQQNFMPSGSSYSDSFNLILPLTFLINNSGCFNNDIAQVYFYVKTNADNAIYETVSNNNVLGSNQTTIINTLVDHIITNVSSSDSIQAGRYFKAIWTVKNIGLNPNDYTYREWRDAIYLSTDSVFNSNARYIGLKGEYTTLDHDQSYTDSAIYQIPNIAAGNYYLFAVTNFSNNIIAERNLSNNSNIIRNKGSNQPIKINVTTPPSSDLINTILSAPTKTAVGQPIKIVYTVTNNGVGATYAPNWTDDIWLSNSFQPGGLFLSRKYHNGILLPGQSYTDSVSVTIPINQPQGNYTIVLFTNQDRVEYESNFANNTSFKYISVYIPAPVDLIVKDISVADTVILGYSTPVSWSLFNNSNNPANGTETDGIYLSKDSAGSANDVLVGTKVKQLNLLPLNAIRDTANPVISGLPEGNYFVKVKTDILNNIIESNKQNNITVRDKKVYVTVKALPINIVTPDILTANYLFYKLVVPASLKGKTVAVKLTTPDSLTANNQLYIGLGYLPSAARFDYAFDKPNYGNQQVIIETVTDSVYYIAAKGTKQSGGNQNITLQATVLPFSILNVNSNHGGNTGNVTIQIKGSLFRDSMIATLRGVSQNNTITASKVYFISSTTVYATFNLQGAPLGLYDVSLQKPDASIATLPSGFTVEKTNNGGLLTGGGGNTGQSGSGNGPGCDPGASSGLNSQLQTEVVAPAKVFASWPFTMQINYTNASNVDIPAQVRILYSLDGAPVALTEAGLAEGKTTLYIEFKDAVGPTNIIRAGGSGTIKVYGKAPANGFPHELLHFTLQ
ncbi:MAG: hypothetical protein M3004_05145, partial [Bacteroidota bacterium]|nr:hypothetical protein [Bacteroidota bacterium]